MSNRFFDADMKNAQKSFLFYNKFFQNLLLPRVLTLVVFCFIVHFSVGSSYFQIPIPRAFPSGLDRMMGLYFLTLFISIPRRFYSMQTLFGTEPRSPADVFDDTGSCSNEKKAH